MRFLTIVSTFILAGVVLIQTSCSDANAETDLGGDRVASSFESLDYKQAVDSCVFKTIDTPDSERTGFAAWWLDGIEGCIGKSVPDRQLTTNEKQRLGLWKRPDGTTTFWSAIVSEMYKYYSTYGELPESGIDFYPELAGSDGYSTLLTLSDEEVLNLYADGIDPITGKFYSDLSCDEWTAGALNVTLVTDPEEIAANYPDLYIPAESDEETKGIKRPDMVWHVVIYGEAEGSVLLDDVVAM